MLKALVVAWLVWGGLLMFRMSAVWRVGMAGTIATLVATIYAGFFWKPAVSIGWPFTTLEGLGIVACLALRAAAIPWYVRRSDRIHQAFAEERKARKLPDLKGEEVYVERRHVVTRAVWGSSDSIFWPHLAVWIVPKMSLVVLLAAGLAVGGTYVGCLVFLAAWFVFDFLWRSAEETEHLPWALLWDASNYEMWWWNSPLWIVLFLTGEAAVPILLRVTIGACQGLYI